MRRRPSPESRPSRDPAGSVSPICALVREGISAHLDAEPAPLSDRDIDRHRAWCRDCDAFAAAASRLRGRLGQACASTVAIPTGGTACARRRPFRHAAAARVHRAGSAFAGAADRLPRGILAMALGVALPPVALGVFAHLHGGQVDVGPHCASLLARHLGASR